VGGWLLEHFWWGSAFLLNVPIAVVALAAGAVLVPESRDPAPPRPDLPGLGLSVVTLTALVYGIIEAPASGWTSGVVIGSLALAVVAGVAFVARERRADEPMVDLRLFRNPRLAWGTVAMTLAGLAIGGLAFELTQYLQFVQGYSPLGACASCRSRSGSGSRARSRSMSCRGSGRPGRWPQRSAGRRWSSARCRSRDPRPRTG
jgi:MFS family permease